MDLSLNALFIEHHHISPNSISLNSQTLVEIICHDSEPSFFEKATLNPAWQKAITEEFLSLNANNSWNLDKLSVANKLLFVD